MIRNLLCLCLLTATFLAQALRADQWTCCQNEWEACTAAAWADYQYCLQHLGYDCYGNYIEQHQTCTDDKATCLTYGDSECPK
jgi:hypothetical protein